jgi:hypothetical protein
MGLMTYVHGQIRLSVDLAEGFSATPEAFNQYGAVLKQIVDRRRLPALGRVLDAGVFDPILTFEESDDQDFDFGLQLFLDGVAGFIERTSS